jgi:chromosome segregation ATPase
MAKEKEKKQELTQALIKQLREDGYCFDPEHMSDIETLRIEAERLKEELKSKNHASIAEYENKNAALEAELKGKKDKVYDLEDELKKSKEEVDTLRDMWTEDEKKLVELRSQLEKEFRKNSACFDPFHTIEKDNRRISISIPEFAALSALILHNPPPDYMNRQIVLILPKYSDLLDRLSTAKDMVEDMMRQLIKAAKAKGVKPPPM